MLEGPKNTSGAIDNKTLSAQADVPNYSELETPAETASENDSEQEQELGASAEEVSETAAEMIAARARIDDLNRAMSSARGGGSDKIESEVLALEKLIHDQENKKLGSGSEQQLDLDLGDSLVEPLVVSDEDASPVDTESSESDSEELEAALKKQEYLHSKQAYKAKKKEFFDVLGKDYADKSTFKRALGLGRQNMSNEAQAAYDEFMQASSEFHKSGVYEELQEKIAKRNSRGEGFNKPIDLQAGILNRHVLNPAKERLEMQTRKMPDGLHKFKDATLKMFADTKAGAVVAERVGGAGAVMSEKYRAFAEKHPRIASYSTTGATVGASFAIGSPIAMAASLVAGTALNETFAKKAIQETQKTKDTVTNSFADSSSSNAESLAQLENSYFESLDKEHKTKRYVKAATIGTALAAGGMSSGFVSEAGADSLVEGVDLAEEQTAEVVSTKVPNDTAKELEILTAQFDAVQEEINKLTAEVGVVEATASAEAESVVDPLGALTDDFEATQKELDELIAKVGEAGDQEVVDEAVSEEDVDSIDNGSVESSDGQSAESVSEAVTANSETFDIKEKVKTGDTVSGLLFENVKKQAELGNLNFQAPLSEDEFYDWISKKFPEFNTASAEVPDDFVWSDDAKLPEVVMMGEVSDDYVWQDKPDAPKDKAPAINSEDWKKLGVSSGNPNHIRVGETLDIGAMLEKLAEMPIADAKEANASIAGAPAEVSDNYVWSADANLPEVVMAGAAADVSDNFVWPAEGLPKVVMERDITEVSDEFVAQPSSADSSQVETLSTEGESAPTPAAEGVPVETYCSVLNEDYSDATVRYEKNGEFLVNKIAESLQEWDQLGVIDLPTVSEHSSVENYRDFLKDIFPELDPHPIYGKPPTLTDNQWAGLGIGADSDAKVVDFQVGKFVEMLSAVDPEDGKIGFADVLKALIPKISVDVDVTKTRF